MHTTASEFINFYKSIDDQAVEITARLMVLQVELKEREAKLKQDFSVSTEHTELKKIYAEVLDLSAELFLLSSLISEFNSDSEKKSTIPKLTLV